MKSVLRKVYCFVLMVFLLGTFLENVQAKISDKEAQGLARAYFKRNIINHYADSPFSLAEIEDPKGPKWTELFRITDVVIKRGNVDSNDKIQFIALVSYDNLPWGKQIIKKFESEMWVYNNVGIGVFEFTKGKTKSKKIQYTVSLEFGTEVPESNPYTYLIKDFTGDGRTDILLKWTKDERDSFRLIYFSSRDKKYHQVDTWISEPDIFAEMQIVKPHQGIWFSPDPQRRAEGEFASPIYDELTKLINRQTNFIIPELIESSFDVSPLKYRK